MPRRGFMALGGAAVLLVAAVGSVCGDSGEDYAALIPPPTERVIEMTGFELKGSTRASELAPPEINPEQLGNGYGFKDVGVYESDSDKWQVASYMWLPGEVTAFQGDTLDLNFFVLNGNKHDVWIEDPDGETVSQTTEMNRGREYQISLRVTKPGVYRLICGTHAPTMTAEIVVLPRGGS